MHGILVKFFMGPLSLGYEICEDCQIRTLEAVSIDSPTTRGSMSTIVVVLLIHDG